MKVFAGRVADGLSLLDEAMVSVPSGDPSSTSAGWAGGLTR
ncbi:hypothetical protein [Streptomyces sp. NPDC086023]